MVPLVVVLCRTSPAQRVKLRNIKTFHLLHNLHSAGDLVVVLTKPEQVYCAVAVYVTHACHLLIALINIGLIYANCVNPDCAFTVWIAEVPKSNLQVGRDIEWFVFE